MPTAPVRYFVGFLAAALLLVGAELRAQTPANPLRPAAPVSIAPQIDPWAGDDDESIQPIALHAGPLSEPESVVPRHLGELPSPAPHQTVWPEGAAAPGEIGHDSLVQPWFTHTDPNDPHRHVGLGRPLIGTSWLNRPWYVGAFLGGMLAGDPLGSVEANNSFFLGGRLGWDFDHYWGLEGRYAFSHPQLTAADGDPLSDRAREYFVDVSLDYYPWGDSQWRPFFSAGLGLQTFRFRDDAGQQISQSLLSMPLGVGLKFYHSPWHTLRLEAYDNIAFGDGRLSSMQNFTLAAGIEYRFGGRPTSYFPWHGSTSHW